MGPRWCVPWPCSPNVAHPRTKIQRSNSTQTASWTNGYTSTSLPTRSYSFLLMPGREYALGSRSVASSLRSCFQPCMYTENAPIIQFAYHETSFFLVRLLQRFSEFSLATDAQPPASRPPASWAGCAGSKGRDKVWPGIHLTMYARVCTFLGLT